MFLTASCALPAAGVIAGHYGDANGRVHGFERGAGGLIATFEAPGAGTAEGYGTYAYGISYPWAIAGSYVDANSEHGFVLAP